jgi:hypothetical protein
MALFPIYRSIGSALSVWAVGFLLMGLLLNIGWGAETTPKSAELKISGDGLFGDLELRHILMLLETSGKKPPFFDGPFIEDSVTILFSRLADDGYLRPQVSVELTLSNGQPGRRAFIL